MNKTLIETTLNVAFKDQKASNFYMCQEVGKVIQTLFNETEPQLEAHVFLNRKDDRSKYATLWLSCPRTNSKSVVLCTIEINRTKNWRDEYFYKSFRVCQDFDIDDKIAKHLEAVERDNAIQELKFKEALALFNHIKNLYPSASIGQVFIKIKDLKDKEWSIRDYFEKGGK